MTITHTLCLSAQSVAIWLSQVLCPCRVVFCCQWFSTCCSGQPTNALCPLRALPPLSLTSSFCFVSYTQLPLPTLNMDTPGHLSLALLSAVQCFLRFLTCCDLQDCVCTQISGNFRPFAYTWHYEELAGTSHR